MNGGLLVDKPAGATSHDIVVRIRKITRIRRVGHAGTLDPFATGLLVVCLGKATRLTQYLVGLDKEYVATVRLGFATDTQDATGQQITPCRSSNGLTELNIASVVEGMVGDQLQIPPMYSAKKVGGERLYRAARQGREVDREAVAIRIHEAEMIRGRQSALTQAEDGTAEFQVRIRCSSGTYIRTWAHDLGVRLGVGGHLKALRRTAVGSFGIDSAHSVEEIGEQFENGRGAAVVVSASDLVAHLSVLSLDEGKCRRVVNGVALESKDYEHREKLRLCNARGELIAVGEMDTGRGVIRPQVVIGTESDLGTSSKNTLG
ncbi:MAG TPA: tRNA pseudouridine(55) synthase TruB [Blastocatellia bacterium]|nr:tRNA pseudouridine(55) synthase TruB [Blastocatellia bacterium]